MGAAIGSLIGWLASRLGGIAAAITAFAAGMALLTGALIAAFTGLLSGISTALPPEFALGIGLMPANVPACLAALATAALLRWGYDAHVRLLEAANSSGLR